MSRKVGIELRILEFFRTAQLEVAESILRLAVAEVKARRPAKPSRRVESVAVLRQEE